MKKTINILLCFAIALNAMAQERTDAEMRTIALQKLVNTQSVKSIGGSASQSPTPTINCTLSRKAFNIYTPQDEPGFVIVARNSRIPAVLAYGDSELKADNIPTDMQWWMQLVEENLNADAPVIGRAKAFSNKVVPNFITTEWSQEAPYNQKTPTIKGSHAPVGCVATAMAQAMNVFKYPASANFTETYYVTDGETSQKTAKVSSTYSWDYKDTYSANAIIQGKKIAQLMVDCGYAAMMDYASSGSGTYNFVAGRALVQHFKYPEECVKTMDRSNSTDAEWFSTIYSELEKKSPIVMGGADEKFGGHAFVLSGVDADGLVYTNWGWAGAGNGFYAIDLMNSPQGSFTHSQDIVYGIRVSPRADDHVEGRITGYSGSPYTFRFGIETDDNGVKRNTLYADLPYGYINYNASEFQGAFGLFAQDLTDGTYWVIAPELQDRDTIPSCYGLAGSSEQYKEFYYYYYIDGEKGLKPGHTYRMSFGVKDNRDIRWRSILCDGGEVAYDVTYTGDINTSTIDPERKDVALPTAVRSITGTETNKHNSTTRVYDLQGRLIHTSPTAQFNLWEVPARGTLIVKQGDKVRKVVK